MDELPRGTVTFLFTDIEGSTHLLHDLGREAYGEKLMEHRRVLREAFRRHGGVEVDTQGDAFFVAFPTARGALDAAQEAQAALELPVRMGVHTGTPLLTGEGYVGADVHRAARIAAAGHGRQVLVSAATAPLQIDFVASQHAPIAVQTFTGVTVIDENPQLSPLVRLSCGGLLGNHPLPASQHVFTTGPPAGRAGALARAERVKEVKEVTCSWQIPADAAGDRLRLGSGYRDGARVAAYTAHTPKMTAGTVSSPESSWVVRP